MIGDRGGEMGVAVCVAVCLCAASACSSDRRRGRVDASTSDAAVDDSGPSADVGIDASLAEAVCDNGLDDDADGLVDEGCPCALDTTQPCYGGAASLAGVGLCAYGTQVCIPTAATAGTWGGCGGWVEPVEETCDAADDDCDGSVDEELLAFCPEGGQSTCGGGEWSPCEMCNGTDDDGDGLVDEELIRPCVDDCDPYGFQTCEGAAWTACVPGRSFDPGVDRGGVELDAASIAGVQTVDRVAFTHTTSGAIADRLLLVGVAIEQPVTITSVTYGGAALTPLTSWTAGSTFVELHVEVYYLLDPAPGSAEIAITLPEPLAVNAGAYTMGNVSGAPRELGSARDRSTDPLLHVDASPGGLVVDFLGKEANHGISPAPGNELGWNICGPGYARFGSSIRAADGPTSLHWDYECCPDEWIMGAVLVSAL